ncbi:tRNA(Ile)-lysidine synthetase [hydrothermal vent metagenome]|uniref:tRNA(Ile)-lysidine synthetase n=1 Tax=hydrothermal vent metagenome TaxID=652676 RepID=A0A1W1EBR4_9ZZZZ
MPSINLSWQTKKKNLLAFSAGVDSSALFFLLLEKQIKFDIALVNYGTRKNSDVEEKHAKDLAKKYNITCYSIKAPKFTNNFERDAREFRYDFFKKICSEHKYENILTAHQLNDQLEWLLMRLTKGAGLSELIGLTLKSKREHYTLVRPLLESSKDELLTYLNQNDYPYFVDESNLEDTYERNRFRKEFSDPLMKKYTDGIRRSFEYLNRDKDSLENRFETTYANKELRVIKLHDINAKSKAVDLTLKELGYLLSSAQRKEIESSDSLVIGGLWAIERKDNFIYIAPYIESTMPKKFKEECRVKKIPSKIRPYLCQEGIDLLL